MLPIPSTMDTATFDSRVNYDTLNAAVVGSAATAVLRFTDPPALRGVGLVDATTAADGTIVIVTKPGLYLVEVAITKGDITTPAPTAVTKNTDAAALTANVVPTIVGKEKFVRAGTTATNIVLSTMVDVTGAEASNGAGALIRVHCNDGAGGAAVLTIAEAQLKVRRVNGLALGTA